MRLVAAPDKLAGTLGAREAARAIAAAAIAAGFDVDELPLSDGGEGFSSLIDGEQASAEVSGPLGERITARYALIDDGRTAVIEMAAAAGRALLPAPVGDDCLRASTAGVGELMADAIGRGVRRVVVGCGGSATTDGGLGMLEAVDAAGGIGDVELVAATDVSTPYRDAARIFGPQKGADADQVAVLAARLERLAEQIDERAGRPVSELPGSGAAGGLGGALLALGATQRSGFDLFASLVGLDARLADADVVVTAEGRVDRGSLEGKAVGGLIERCPADVRILVIAGSVDDEAAQALGELRAGSVEIVSMVESVGRERSLADPAGVLAEIVAERLS